jgi:hypothetical protein
MMWVIGVDDGCSGVSCVGLWMRRHVESDRSEGGDRNE